MNSIQSPNEPTDLLRSQDIPLIRFPVVWHVGTMDVGQKRTGSQEGNALSVSRHPQAWSRIARCSGSTCVEITATTGRSLDFADILMIRFSPKHAGLRDALTRQALQAGYLVPSTAFQWEYWDDEWGETRFMRFRTMAEALSEAEELEGTVTPVEILTGTSTFCAAHKLDEDPTRDYRELAWMSVLQNACPDLHGVWWNEQYDPAQYSAPRGGLFLDRIGLRLERKPLSEVPDSDEHLVDVDFEQGD